MSANKIKKSAVEFVQKAQTIHGTKFNYSKIEYTRCDKKVIIICPIHKEFKQTPSCHLNGSGCPQCSFENKSKNYIFTQEEIINKFNFVHNFKYDYSEVLYTGSKNKIKIICKNHGEFLQRVSNHLNGNGCPQCKAYISKSETKWLDYLKIPVEYRQIRITINNKIKLVDAYNPITNTIYEFNGDYWHGNPKIYNPNDINFVKNKTFSQLYYKTIEREKVFKENGYNVISIWENDWKNLIK